MPFDFVNVPNAYGFTGVENYVSASEGKLIQFPFSPAHFAVYPQLKKAIGQYLSSLGMQTNSTPFWPKGQKSHNFLLHIRGTKSKVISNCSG